MRRTTSFALLRLHVMRWDHSLSNWLFSLGFLPDRDASPLSKAYSYYSFALGPLTSWGGLLSLTLQAVESAPTLHTVARAALPTLVGFAAAALAAVALLRPPLQLSPEDVAYLAPAPLPRSSLALVRLVPSWLGLMAFTPPAGGVLSVLASASPNHYLRTMLALVPLTLGATGLAWALGLTRLHSTRPLLRAALWTVPLLLLAALIARLPWMLAPGRWILDTAALCRPGRSSSRPLRVWPSPSWPAVAGT